MEMIVQCTICLSVWSFEKKLRSPSDFYGVGKKEKRSHWGRDRRAVSSLVIGMDIVLSGS